MKVTTQTASRWVKAIFLALLGIIILLYLDRFVNDVRNAYAAAFPNGAMLAATWDFVRILLWVLVAWLFVDAALTIVLSFTEHRFTLVDVMERLDAIEKRLGPPKPKLGGMGSSPSGPAVTEAVPEEAPPPPVE